PLAAQAREFFTGQASQVLPDLAKAILDRLEALLDQPASAPVSQERRDTWMAFQAAGKAWTNGTHKAWTLALGQPGQAAISRLDRDSGDFQLMDNEVMENKILASRLALRLLDVATWELNDLRLRVQSLDKISELDANDILRPEVLSRLMVEQWTESGLTRGTWVSVQEVVQAKLAERLLEAYHQANEFLVQRGVMADIDLRPLVKRTPSAIVKTPSAGGKSGASLAFDDYQSQSSFTGGGGGGASGGSYGGSFGSGGSGGGRSGGGGSGSGGSGSGGSTGRGGVGGGSGGGGVSGGSGGGGSSGNRGNPGSYGGSDSPHEETRMQTGTTPLARARMRAQGVMGSLKRLLSNQVAGFDDTRGAQASPQLAQALAGMLVDSSGAIADARGVLVEGPDQVYSPAHVEQATAALRQQTTTLKKAASTSAEKATIEIVALMFQSILAEDRIPPTVRVWFARLQMPVLRVAISEPEFFGSLQHPARRLIDRMGSCVLGFDVAVSGGAMEIEIKRIVQVIEQYPETGRRVFQLVYDEFQKFLSKFLSENGSAARVVSIAQQVEQKETMAIQYTIEMRSLLNDMPVREEIREFLFKIWAEVLALAAMRNGPQHEETMNLKRAAADLVWAASAKPNRADRAKVISDLPKLLQLLRLGMTMLAMDTKAQDQQLKVISDTLADAFMSKTDAISTERIDAMSKRLTNLEDYLSDEDVGDLPLDTEALVMMIGIDASDLEVVTDGGSQPTEAMRAWAQELQLGAWFSLDHNGRVSHVQFAWRSDRKQLHLFASADGRNFLIQARRLAAYLQAGLLIPTEEEALTVRATRDALAKLEANPERLLG
ncbi:MAG: DUF1631 family protein, partial [Vitreoscilla sp.]|nr:DUF1631 family protein [Polaromonas sp.]